jgi:ATP-dependent helicase/nuclease subunit A
MHRLFQFLPDLAPARRREAGARWLNSAARAFLPAERAEMLENVLAVLEAPAFAPLFGPGSRAEVPLSGIVGGHIVSAQVDRLVVGADEVQLVDFKTHRPAPERLQDVPDLYYKQMAAYAGLLAAIYPGKILKTYLLWTDGPRLMELPPERLAGYAP